MTYIIASIYINGVSYDVYEFFGKEEMSHGFNFNISIAADVNSYFWCLDDNFSFSNKGILKYQDKAWHGRILKQKTMQLDSHGMRHYQIEFVSELDFISYVNGYAIFYDKKISEIIQGLLGNTIKCQFNFKEQKLKYWTQYKESARSTLNRLCFQNHIIYFFDCRQANLMVFVDSTVYLDHGIDLEISRSKNNLNRGIVTSWHVIHDTYPLEEELYGSNEDSIVSIKNENNESHSYFKKHEAKNHMICDSAIDSQDLALKYRESMRAALKTKQYIGNTYDEGISIGYQYQIRDAGSIDQYYVTAVEHQFKKNQYSNKCIFCKQRDMYFVNPSDVHASFETATIVTADGFDIDSENGMVKIKFDWQDNVDVNDLPYVPLLNTSAGHNFGSMFIPRKGHRVIIGFISGNPNKPFIAGSLYQIHHDVPYRDNNVSCIRTKSFDDVDKYNEIVLYDNPGKEHIKQYSCGDLIFEADKSICHTNRDGSTSITIGGGDFNVGLVDTNGKSGNVNISTSQGNMNVKLQGAMKIDVNNNYHFLVNGKICETIISQGVATIKAPKIAINSEEIHVSCKSIVVTADESVSLNSKNGISIACDTTVKIAGSMIEIN